MNKLTPSEKKKLKERLKKLDKIIGLIQELILLREIQYTQRVIFPDLYKKCLELDAKRKQIRNKLK